MIERHRARRRRAPFQITTAGRESEGMRSTAEADVEPTSCPAHTLCQMCRIWAFESRSVTQVVPDVPEWAQVDQADPISPMSWAFRCRYGTKQATRRPEVAPRTRGAGTTASSRGRGRLFGVGCCGRGRFDRLQVDGPSTARLPRIHTHQCGRDRPTDEALDDRDLAAEQS